MYDPTGGDPLLEQEFYLTQGPLFMTLGACQEAADFVVEQPTPLPDHPEIKVLHYSTPISVPAVSRLIAIPPPSYS